MLGALFTILPQEIFTLLLLGAQKVIYSVADWQLKWCDDGECQQSIDQSINQSVSMLYWPI